MDTEAQRRVLKTNRVARIVRKRFPDGTRVVSLAGMTGTVLRHIPHSNSLGGVLKVEWDEPKFESSKISTVNPTVVKPLLKEDQ